MRIGIAVAAMALAGVLGWALGPAAAAGRGI